MTTVDYAKKIENGLNELVLHSVRLEMDNAELKKVIRIMASSQALDENGNMTMQYTQEDVDYIKRVVERVNVFNTLEGDNHG